MPDKLPLAPVVWIGSSRKDLRALPDPVQDKIGYALYVAQCGEKHRDAKALKGFGDASVQEDVEIVVKPHRGTGHAPALHVH